MEVRPELSFICSYYLYSYFYYLMVDVFSEKIKSLISCQVFVLKLSSTLTVPCRIVGVNILREIGFAFNFYYYFFLAFACYLGALNLSVIFFVLM